MPAWQLSADPARFDEAIDFFGKRTVMTAAEAAALDLDSRQRAFWVGGGLHLAQVQRVFDEIGKALDSGEPFEDWRKRVRSTLRDDAHAETVFRNATQRALNAGRYRQMKDPAVVKFRPYFMQDSVLDSGTTAQCRALDGIILPADHEHWSMFWPPGHHKCRRGVRSLRKAEAERRGITNVPPVLPATPGWGNPPDAQGIWVPDPKKHDPKLTKELEKKKTKADKRPAPKTPKSKPEHDPKFWEKDYGHLGEAAPCAAYGRAMLERGLDRSAADVRAEYERLRAAKHPACGPDISEWFKGLPPNRPLRNTVVGRQLRSAVALTEHTRSINPAVDFAAQGGSGKALAAVADAQRFYRLSLDKSVRAPVGLHIDKAPAKVRAFFSKRAVRDDGSIGPRIVLDASDEPKTAVHELAHALEHSDDRALARSRAFLLARTKGEKLQKLKDLLPGAQYEDNEVAWQDEFWSPYVGKDYGEIYTEVTSMGYERMMDGINWFVRRSRSQADEEALFFMLGQLAGK